MPLAGMEIGHSPFTFVPIAEICGGSHDLDYLVGEFMFIYTTVIPSNSFESICNFIGYFHLTLFIDQFFLDVIGMLTGVGTERTYDRNGTSTNLNVLAIEEDGYGS
jgi:hypothetical protein